MAHLWQRRVHILAVSRDHPPGYLPRSRQFHGICQSSTQPDRSRIGRSGTISGLGIQLLSHSAQPWAAAAPWPGKVARPAQAANQLQSQRTLSGLDLGARRDPA